MPIFPLPDPQDWSDLDALCDPDVMMMDDYAPSIPFNRMAPGSTSSFVSHNSSTSMSQPVSSIITAGTYPDMLPSAAGQSPGWGMSKSNASFPHGMPSFEQMVGSRKTSSVWEDFHPPSMPTHPSMDSNSSSSAAGDQISSQTMTPTSRCKTVLVLDSIPQNALYKILSIALEHNSKIKVETIEQTESSAGATGISPSSLSDVA